jgi:hypothetical protein
MLHDDLAIHPSTYTFPHGFLWGAATAAHQVEGNNINSDLWVLEHVKPTLFVEPSLDACDHYHRFAEDIRLLAGLGLNTYRFSIEWSRIEPEHGVFSTAALEHYRRMLAACLENGVIPMVTFYHFSSPTLVRCNGRMGETGCRRSVRALLRSRGAEPGRSDRIRLYVQRTESSHAAALGDPYRGAVHHGAVDG